MIDERELIEEYMYQRDWRVRENANTTFSIQGLNFHVVGRAMAEYWLNKLFPPYISERHRSGDIHLHDLSLISAYCSGWDLMDLIKVGFTGVPGKVVSKPARHLSVLLGHVYNFLYTMQNEFAGAVAFSNFDTLLAPFVHYDQLSYNQLKQLMQEFIFNLNVSTRIGMQVPFTNISMDLTPPSYLKDLPVIIGGEERSKTYGDFQDEMDMINNAMSEVFIAGDGAGRPFTFPIPNYNVTKDFEWESNKLKPLFEMTAKYGIPYWSNFVNSDLDPSDIRSMCCHLRLDKRELRNKGGGGLFGAGALTGSVSVTTINLPRIGYLSKDKTEYFDRLDDLLDIAKEASMIRRAVVEEMMELGMYPYARFYLRSIKESSGHYFDNHFSTIGIIGMNESCMNFMNQPITTPECTEFAVEVMHHIRDRLSDFQEQTDVLFNLEAVPGEGASYRLAKHDIKRYPDIYTSGTKQRPYYTNSTMPPVDWTDDIFEFLEHQNKLLPLYTGGSVAHVYLGERVYSTEAIKKLIKTITYNFEIPYFTITPTFSICPIHGYIPGEHEFCPICDDELKKKKANKASHVKPSGDISGLGLSISVVKSQ